MRTRLRQAGPLTQIALRAAIGVQLLWVSVAPVQHLLSHDVEAAARSVEALDRIEAASQATGPTWAPETEQATDAGCLVCLLLAGTKLVQPNSPDAVQLAGVSEGLHINSDTRAVEQDAQRLFQARAPPAA